ncbi:MAG TPA: hypothetical protein VID70_07900 [Solirubrobacteraceae bacterium]|jgi:hypothetical protein
MAGDALFLGWGPVVRGRELKSLEVFQEALEYYGQLQQAGRLENFEPVFLAPHGGDLGGFILARGERKVLDEIASSPEFLRIVARAAAVVDNIGVIAAYAGEAIAQQLAAFRAASEELA